MVIHGSCLLHAEQHDIHPMLEARSWVFIQFFVCLLVLFIWLFYFSYCNLSITTFSLPLSAGNTRMWSFFWRLLMALCSVGSKFTWGGLTLLSAPVILVLTSSACSSGTRIRPLSTAATTSAGGILVGAGEKFRPSLRTAFSASDRGLEDRFTTHLRWAFVSSRVTQPCTEWCLSFHCCALLRKVSNLWA